MLLSIPVVSAMDACFVKLSTKEPIPEAVPPILSPKPSASPTASLTAVPIFLKNPLLYRYYY